MLLCHWSHLFFVIPQMAAVQLQLAELDDLDCSLIDSGNTLYESEGTRCGTVGEEGGHDSDDDNVVDDLEDTINGSDGNEDGYVEHVISY